MSETAPLRVGQTLNGPLFNEPTRVETVSAAGNSSWVVGLVGAQSERFRRVTMSESDLAAISILDAEMAFNGDGNLLRLGIQAYTLGIANDFDPYFDLSISRVDRLPHQLEAVYDYLLKFARVRFLLAYADVKSIREAMDRRRAPFYLRRTKEAMIYFPERQPDNTWVAKKIFTKRIPHTVDFHIDGAEFDLY